MASDEKRKKLTVTSYAGHRGEEEPRAFLLGDERIEVLSVQKRWIEETDRAYARKRCFTVKGSDGYVHTLCYDESSKEWFLET